MVDEEQNSTRSQNREVRAELIETLPENGGLFHWILASPMILFLAWIWVDLFAHYSPLTSYWLDVVLGLLVFVLLVILPVGVGAFFVVTAAPRLFHHAGWDVQPLEPVSEDELHTVRFRYEGRHRAANSWSQAWTRAAQGWVYLEIFTILVGAVVMIPVFFSVSEYGFGQP